MELWRRQLKLDPLRFYGGLIVALGLSATLYQFTLLLAEGIRFLSINYYYELWPLSEEEDFYFRLVFALIALITGLSYLFQIWFHQVYLPEGKQRKRLAVLRSKIYNDQTFLQWGFLSWFSRVAFVYIIVFGLTFFEPNAGLKFATDYYWLFPAILLVMFLQLWSTLLRLYGRKTYVYMAFTAVLIFQSAWLFTHWELADTRTIERRIGSKNPFIRFGIELTESEFGELAPWRSSHELFIVGQNKGNTSGIYERPRPHNLNTSGQLPSLVYSSDLDPNNRFRRPPRNFGLVVDPELKMSELINAHQHIAIFYNYWSVWDYSQTSFYYAVSKNGSSHDSHYGIPVRYFLPEVEEGQSIDQYPFTHKIILRPTDEGLVIWEGRALSQDELVLALSTRLYGLKSFIFLFEDWGQSSYPEYLNTVISIRASLETLRLDQGSRVNYKLWLSFISTKTSALEKQSAE